MPRYRRRSRTYSYSRNVGAERARAHIEAARKLSVELGGHDKDVKAWFFSLNSRDLSRVLDAYGEKFGGAARDYAAATIPKWKSGQVQMGGMVAERLFKLLPPFMPLSLKYKLTEGLWHHFGPSSKKTLWIGVDADIERIQERVRAHFADKASQFRIPASMESRFDWIAANDVAVKQDLLNHLREMEKRLASDALLVQLPALFEHIRLDREGHTKHVSQVVKVGKHEMELVVDKRVSGIRDIRPISARERYAWLPWALVAAIVLFFLLFKPFR